MTISQSEELELPVCKREQEPNSWCGCEDKCMFEDGIEIDDRVIKAILKMEKKYCDLVWLARKRPEDYLRQDILRSIKQVEFLYEDEVKELGGEHGDWQHGFHSGVLAGLRYVLAISDFGIEQAEEDFPCLDT